jgi:hypothetical protein
MLSPTVQAAFVVVLAWLIRLLCDALGITIDDATLNTLAAAIVVYLLSRVGVASAVRAGLLDSPSDE